MKLKFFVIKGKNQYSQIYARFWDSKIIDQKTKTGLTVLFKNWDKKNERVKNKVTATDKDFINKKLLELKAFVFESYNIEYNESEIIGKKWLKNKIDVFFNRKDLTTPEALYFTDWISVFIEKSKTRLHKGKNISQSTTKKYKTVLNNLREYEEIKGEKLKFEDVTLNFYFDFVDYCKTVKKLGTNTIGTRIKAIKFFCKQIELEDLPISEHYKNPQFVAQEEKVTDIYLTTNEIDSIFNHDFRQMPYLDNARDLLIIGLNTGLRVSDFMRLDLSHINGDTIRIRAKKTNKIAEIPINTQVQKTLQKNNGNLPHRISEQKFNKYIKEIGEIIGITEMVKGSKMVCINETEAKKKGVKKQFRKVSGTFPKYELMTSHICRRSFATNLYGQIPTPVIMAITGHATETQFLTYIKKTKTENAEVLRNFYKKQAENKGLEPTLKIV